MVLRLSTLSNFARTKFKAIIVVVSLAFFYNPNYMDCIGVLFFSRCVYF